LKVEDRCSRSRPFLPTGRKAQRRPSRGCASRAASGLGGRHHLSRASQRLSWSTCDVRSRWAPCSCSRQCPRFGQTFVRTVTPASAYRPRRRRAVRL